MIPKSVNAARIAENFKSLEVKLDEEDMRRIKEVDKNTRFLSVRGLVCNISEQSELGDSRM